MQISQNQMEENRIKFYELVNTFYDNPKTVLNYLEEKDAFTQPASTRTHLAVCGGNCIWALVHFFEKFYKKKDDN